MPTLLSAVNQCLDQYLTTCSKSSRSTWKSHARVFCQLWGERRLDELTPTDIQRWVHAERERVKPATIRHRLSWLSQVYMRAVEAGTCVYNPVASVKRPRVDNRRRRCLSPEEEQRLEKIMAPEDFEAVRFALLTGLRRAEQFRLEAHQVDTTMRALNIMGSKTEKQRTVPLHDEASEVLANRLEKNGRRLFMPRMSKSDPVIVGANWVARKFKPAVKEAGIQDLRWHDLRRTFATRLIENGVGVLQVKELLGHASLEHTQRYAYVAPPQLRQAVDSLARRQVKPEPSPAPVAPGQSDVLELSSAAKAAWSALDVLARRDLVQELQRTRPLTTEAVERAIARELARQRGAWGAPSGSCVHGGRASGHCLECWAQNQKGVPGRAGPRPCPK